jgi:uncharacterized protein involved in exopolysaccharide biosynthesis
VILFWPRKYTSEGKIFVQIGRTNVAVDPTATAAGVVSIQDSRETEIRSVVELVQSQAVLQRVVERLTPERILGNARSPLDWVAGWLPGRSGSGEVAAGNESELSPEQIATMRQQERGVRRLRSSMWVDSEKKTSLVTVSCKSYDPLVAQEIVQAILEAYRELHVRVNATEGSLDFFEEQFAAQHHRVEEAMRALEQYRSQRNYLSIEGARRSLQDIAAQIERQMVETAVDLGQNEEKTVRLREQLASIQPELGMPMLGLVKPSTEAAREEMFRLESERAGLLATLTPDHPKVQAINERIAKLEQQVSQAPEQRTETVTELNPVFSEIKIELVRSVAEGHALRVRREALQEKYADVQSRMRALNSDEVEDARLQRAIDVARADFDLYAKKRGEAQVLAELDKDRISNVVIAQRASLQWKPISPRNSVVAALGVALAVIISLLAGWRAGLRDRRADSARGRPEDESPIPVLVTLPRQTPARSVAP